MRGEEDSHMKSTHAKYGFCTYYGLSILNFELVLVGDQTKPLVEKREGGGGGGGHVLPGDGL